MVRRDLRYYSSPTDAPVAASAPKPISIMMAELLEDLSSRRNRSYDLLFWASSPLITLTAAACPSSH